MAGFTRKQSRSVAQEPNRREVAHAERLPRVLQVRVEQGGRRGRLVKDLKEMIARVLAAPLEPVESAPVNLVVNGRIRLERVRQWVAFEVPIADPGRRL